MATIRRGSSASGSLVWGSIQPIALVDLSVILPPKPEPPKPEPPKPEPPKPIPVPPKPRPPVAFPTDAEFTDFTAKLDALYRDEMGRPAEPTHVDALGRGRWTYDYALHRQAGLSHAAAWAKVDAEIRRIAGLPPNP